MPVCGANSSYLIQVVFLSARNTTQTLGMTGFVGILEGGNFCIKSPISLHPSATFGSTLGDLTEGLERAILIATTKRVGSKLRADKTEKHPGPNFGREGPGCCAHLSV